MKGLNGLLSRVKPASRILCLDPGLWHSHLLDYQQPFLKEVIDAKHPQNFVDLDANSIKRLDTKRKP